jgi:hypothetical protein
VKVEAVCGFGASSGAFFSVMQMQHLVIMSTPELALEVWKMRLKEDCERQDKLLAYRNLGDECLKVLWEAGTDPRV